MRWLEVRRHSLTKKGPARGRGSHLSAQGVALARAVGAELGPVAYVLTSTSPRAIETAIAMGLAVHETVDLPSGYVPGEVEFHEQWSWAQPYVRYAELIQRGQGLAAVTRAHRAVWTRAVESVDDGTAALLVGHGGGIEPTLVACLPDADYRRWGALFGHCDGARLGFENGAFVDIQFRRAPATPRLMPRTPSTIASSSSASSRRRPSPLPRAAGSRPSSRSVAPVSPCVLRNASAPPTIRSPRPPRA